MFGKPMYVLHKRIRSLRRRLDEPTPAPTPEKPEDKDDTPDVDQYISKSVLREFSKTSRRFFRNGIFRLQPTYTSTKPSAMWSLVGACAEAEAPDFAPSPIQPSR
jgi:hypothetical protein